MGGAPRGSVSDLLLGHGEDELALGAVRHGRLDDVADAGRGQLEVARVDERLDGGAPKIRTWTKKSGCRRPHRRGPSRRDDAWCLALVIGRNLRVKCVAKLQS